VGCHFSCAIESFKTDASWLSTVLMMPSFAIALGISKVVAIPFLIAYVAMGMFHQLSHFLAHSKVPLSGFF
jgi:hypothetical protein